MNQDTSGSTQARVLNRQQISEPNSILSNDLQQQHFSLQAKLDAMEVWLQPREKCIDPKAILVALQARIRGFLTRKQILYSGDPTSKCYQRILEKLVYSRGDVAIRPLLDVLQHISLAHQQKVDEILSKCDPGPAKFGVNPNLKPKHDIESRALKTKVVKAKLPPPVQLPVKASEYEKAAVHFCEEQKASMHPDKVVNNYVVPEVVNSVPRPVPTPRYQSQTLGELHRKNEQCLEWPITFKQKACSRKNKIPYPLRKESSQLEPEAASVRTITINDPATPKKSNSAAPEPFNVDYDNGRVSDGEYPEPVDASACTAKKEPPFCEGQPPEELSTDSLVIGTSKSKTPSHSLDATSEDLLGSSSQVHQGGDIEACTTNLMKENSMPECPCDQPEASSDSKGYAYCVDRSQYLGTTVQQLRACELQQQRLSLQAKLGAMEVWLQPREKCIDPRAILVALQARIRGFLTRRQILYSGDPTSEGYQHVLKELVHSRGTSAIRSLLEDLQSISSTHQQTVNEILNECSPHPDMFGVNPNWTPVYDIRKAIKTEQVKGKPPLPVQLHLKASTAESEKAVVSTSRMATPSFTAFQARRQILSKGGPTSTVPRLCAYEIREQHLIMQDKLHVDATEVCLQPLERSSKATLVALQARIRGFLTIKQILYSHVPTSKCYQRVLEKLVRSRGAVAIRPLLEDLQHISSTHQQTVTLVLRKCDVCDPNVSEFAENVYQSLIPITEKAERGKGNWKQPKSKSSSPTQPPMKCTDETEAEKDLGEFSNGVTSVLCCYHEHYLSVTDVQKQRGMLCGLHNSAGTSDLEVVTASQHNENGKYNCEGASMNTGAKKVTKGVVQEDSAQTVYTQLHTVVGNYVVPKEPSYQSKEHSIFRVATDCLHALDYQNMYQLLLTMGDLSSTSAKVARYFGCGLALFKMSQLKEACVYFHKAEDIAVAVGDISLCNAYIGDAQSSKQSYSEAVKCYIKSIDCYSRDSVAQVWRMVPPSLSSLHAKLASALRNSSKAIDAVQAYKKAIATADSKKDRLAAHTSLGNLYQSLGENTSALTEYEQAIKLAEDLQDYVSLGWAHGNIGNAYLGLYQKDKALYHLLKSLDLTVQHEPTPQAISRAYNNLGTAHQALNELDKAQEYFDLALGQAIYGEDRAGQARVYGNIGNVLMIKKTYDRAIPHYSEVLRLSKDQSTVSTAYHNRGCAYYEWAETKKKSLLKRQAGEPTKFFLHVSDPMTFGDESRPPIIPDSILKYFKLGAHDLQKVVKHHEATLENIKGSTMGLTLSVSLSESNSRTFHRLQDCLVSTGEWREALVVAEQSRSRTLGELLHKKNKHCLEGSLKPPITLEQIFTIVNSQKCPVIYLSYTGVRILVWVLVPDTEGVQMNMVEVPVEDDQFDGKSLDYHLRYSLTEVLVERSFEMYNPFDYQSELNNPVRSLYSLIGCPIRKAFSELNMLERENRTQKVIVIPDSYTNLIPFTCLLDPQTGHFLGDYYSFQIMPSLLSMGILDQLPQVKVTVPCTDSHSMCIIGNPSIPPFHYSGEVWKLGKLPHAEREAKWVAYILKTSAILKEQATKNAVLMRIANSKIVHIATHGSASAGFLAFAGIVPFGKNEAVDASDVLLYPSDIEKLNISPALVVLSSCDSGRGTVKADGIIGMARAFLSAGAHAVLTTLWRVPDESASVFMQLFYQFLSEGCCSSEALQKATLSLRCFSKYSQYIHWSGYQLTGREVQLVVQRSSTTCYLEACLGSSSIFPRLNIVSQLESSLIADHRGPTDVQVLTGAPGTKPSEPLIDFVHSFHHHYKAGIFWINGSNTEFIGGSLDYIQQVTGKCLAELHPTIAEKLLIIFDKIEHLPSDEDLFKLLRNPNTDIVVIAKNTNSTTDLQKEVDQQLIRGCNVIDVMPLTMIHTTQRIAHAVLREHHFAPQNKDQTVFATLAEFTTGSPCIVNLASSLLLSHMHDQDDVHKSLHSFTNTIVLDGAGSLSKPKSVVLGSRQQPQLHKVRSIAKGINELSSVYTSGDKDPWCTTADYDAWQSVSRVVQGCRLSTEERLLLYCLSIFGCSPVPMALVSKVSFLIGRASHGSRNLLPNLLKLSLVKPYPMPVVLHPSVDAKVTEDSEHVFVYTPQILSRAIWKDVMSDLDKVAALTTTYKALLMLKSAGGPPELQCLLIGNCTALLEAFEVNFDLLGRNCYKEVYKLYLQMKVASHSTGTVELELQHYLQ